MSDSDQIDLVSKTAAERVTVLVTVLQSSDRVTDNPSAKWALGTLNFATYWCLVASLGVTRLQHFLRHSVWASESQTT
jgi:hypothetical protein